MTISIVPFFDPPSFTQSLVLEGSLFQFQFDYNERGACWYMSLADADGVDIYNGVKLVLGFPLLKKCRDPRRPGAQTGTTSAGDLIVTSSTSDLTPPSYFDLAAGGKNRLKYISSDWMALLLAGQTAPILAQYAAGSTSGVSPISTYGQSP